MIDNMQIVTKKPKDKLRMADESDGIKAIA